MKLECKYNFHFSSSLPEQLAQSFDLSLPHGQVFFETFDPEKKTANVKVTVKVDEKGLSLAEPHEILGGTPQEGGIDVPEKSTAYEVAVSAS